MAHLDAIGKLTDELIIVITGLSSKVKSTQSIELSLELIITTGRR